MEFELPVTKEELQVVLKEIDDYYRNYKGEYEERPLEVPVLEKLDFTMPVESEVRRNVQEEFGQKIDAEAAEKTAEYEARRQAYEALYAAESTLLQKRLEDARLSYEEKKKKLQADAAKRGIAQTSVYLSLAAELEEEYGRECAELNRQKQEKKAEYQREIDQADYRVQLTEEAVSLKYGALVEDEVRARMEKAKELFRETTKYNNQVEEKLVKSRNAKIETESTLKLRYLEITAKGLTEEQLTSLGYYQDTIKAIDGYYYTVDAQSAYDDFTKDSSMNYYLGPFYDDILYKYTLRKNNP